MGIEFGHPWVLVLLVLPVLLFALWVWAIRRGQRQLRELSRAASATRPIMPAALTCLAAAAIIVAAALPRWGTRESQIPRQGAEIVFVLDVSRSMGAQDVQPSRIAASRDAIIATLDRLNGDRAGLVIFAGDARLRFPLTSDFAAASQVVRSLETGAVIVQGGTSASQGLDVALGAFDQKSDAGHLIVLISDGDDLGEDPTAAADRVRQAGAELLVAGVGTAQGATVPVFDNSKQQTVDKVDASGAPIISRLNEQFLRNIAATAGGQYVGADLGALPGAVSGRVAALKSAEFARADARVPVERFQWFAAAGLALLVLAAVSERVPRFSRRQVAVGSVAGLALLLLSACATQAYSLNEDGRAAMRAGDFQRAAELFQQAQTKEPDNLDITLNLAAAQHAAGQYDEAARTARRAVGAPTAAQRAQAYISIGHHRFAMNDLPAALDAFRSALLEEPGNATARHDYEVVQRLMSGEQQQPQPGNGAGSSPTPGDASATPDDGLGPPDQPPSASPTPSGAQPNTGQNSQPGTPGELQKSLDAIDAEIAKLTEPGKEHSAADAQRVLDLIAERARIAAMRDALAGGGDPHDY